MDTVTAKIDGSYRIKLIIMTVVLLALSGWFAYDGFVKYPLQQEQSEVYASYMQPAVGDPDYDGWVEEAKANGWSEKAPKPKSDNDIMLQKVLSSICLVLGLVVGTATLRRMLLTVSANEEGLAVNGNVTPWAELTEVESSKWLTKGILIVRHANGKVLLDDWKMQRDPVHAIATIVEEKLGVELPKSAAIEDDEDESNGEAEASEEAEASDKATASGDA